ncbi:MAG: hypothetical protein NT076_01240, partial [Candidatus Pacearchaeota archaeon]|nr:hypothetical protein [Candidatus Pacearchaeota archaeon]
EPEYRINLPKENLKRSRQARSELTNFKETTELADIVLAQVQDNELIFPFCYANAKKILNRAVNLTKAKCIPKGQKVTWKDLRSSMACYLLREGWSSDEINSRLGHKPSSKELDKYCNFLAINRHKPKQKIFNNNMDKVQNDIEELRHIIKLYSEREKRKDEENNLKFEDYKKDNETLAQALKVIENKLKK